MRDILEVFAFGLADIDLGLITVLFAAGVLGWISQLVSPPSDRRTRPLIKRIPGQAE